MDLEIPGRRVMRFQPSGRGFVEHHTAWVILARLAAPVAFVVGAWLGGVVMGGVALVVSLMFAVLVQAYTLGSARLQIELQGDRLTIDAPGGFTSWKTCDGSRYAISWVTRTTKACAFEVLAAGCSTSWTSDS